MSCVPKHQEWALEEWAPQLKELRGQRVGPRPPSPQGEEVTHRGGRPRPSCLQSPGQRWGERGGSEEGRRQQPLEGGGKAPAEAPWTREEQAGAGRFARSKKGCRGGSRGQEGGGEGAGQRLRPGGEGGGGLEGGCPTANTHTGQPGMRGVEMLRGRQASEKGRHG